MVGIWICVFSVKIEVSLVISEINIESYFVIIRNQDQILY